MTGGNYASFDEVDHAINEKASVDEAVEDLGTEEPEVEELAEEEDTIVVDEGFIKTIEATLELQDTHDGLRSWSKENEKLLKSLPDVEKEAMRDAYKKRAEAIMKNGEDE